MLDNLELDPRRNGDQQRSLEEPLFDRRHHVPPIGDLLVERVVAQRGAKRGLQLQGEPEPSPRCLQELLGEVDLVHLHEPGRRHQLGLTSVRRDRPRAPEDRPSMIPPRQAGRDEDREEGHATRRNEDPPARSQHRELGGQSTEDIRMDDGIEALGLEGQLARARHDGSRPFGDALDGGSVLGDPEPLFR